MTKIFLIVILIFIVLVFILILIIKSMKLKIKNYQSQIENNKMDFLELNKKYEKLLEENEIEKQHKTQLAKKLADIACMSIDDVLQQLQK